MKETFHAIHAAETESFLSSLGVLTALRSGQLSCNSCGAVITLDNFQAVGRMHGNLVFICSTQGCLLGKANKEDLP